jgi:catechol 2,3-dioxygenase-like lactoylglutathione lyase family enzyme
MQEAPVPAKSTVRGLYHFAFPCRDAEETRHFYEDVLGLPLVHCMRSDEVPSSGERIPYAHLFFEMGDGSYIAFFDLGGTDKPLPSPNTPDWVQHFAMETGSVAEVLAMKQRLEAADIPVRGIVDHGFIKSIYFFDPNGLRLEVTTRTEAPGFLEAAAAEAHEALRGWSQHKATRLAARKPEAVG